MNESEQAQAIEGAKSRCMVTAYNRHNFDFAVNDRAALLVVVDSQAQRIAEQAKEIERLTLMCKQEDAQK